MAIRPETEVRRWMPSSLERAFQDFH